MDDTKKFLTRKQWDAATTEQRSGFLSEGYLVKDFPVFTGPDSLESVAHAARRRRAQKPGQ